MGTLVVPGRSLMEILNIQLQLIGVNSFRTSWGNCRDLWI